MKKISQEIQTGDDYLLDLQLAMATSSINHEYARMEFDEIGDIQRRDELLAYMTECREEYLKAREELKSLNPLILEQFERDLSFQKQTALRSYNA